MPLRPGQLLQNRYRVVKMLAQGGMGAVYRAWDTTLNRPCAVKENLDTSAEAQRQFQREATMLANLSHPNLPRVTDYFFLPGQGQYLVMDFVEGEDLDEMLSRRRRIPENEALAWVQQVCDALEYLHGQNVIHRDVKPANVKITPAGRAMLVDFGISKVYDPQLQTTTGARAVTPGYSPWEQYGQGRTDARSDVYALGATLYALLTGQVPPESVNLMGGAVALIPPRHLNPAISADTQQAILRAMEQQPSQRFQSAAEMKQALVAALSPAQAYSPPTSLAKARRAPGGFSWLALGFFGVVVVILLVAVAVGAYIYTAPSEEITGVPTVVSNSPPSSSQVQVGEEVIVQATATDSRGVTRVELLVNRVLYHSDASPSPQGQSPFISQQSWRASSLGTYTLMVRAYNAAGEVSQPAAITVNVVGITTPGPGEPTATPTATSTPAPGMPTAAWTPTPTPTGCTLDAAFVADVTVPDGTVFSPGDRIDKIWRIRNSGSCPWEGGYTWVSVSGDQMGAPASHAVSATAAGANVDIGVTMYAPSTPGTYTGYWRMKSPDGQVFGHTCTVKIVVPAPASVTPTFGPEPSVPSPLLIETATSEPSSVEPREYQTKHFALSIRGPTMRAEALIGQYMQEEAEGVYLIVPVRWRNTSLISRYNFIEKPWMCIIVPSSFSGCESYDVFATSAYYDTRGQYFSRERELAPGEIADGWLVFDISEGLVSPVLRIYFDSLGSQVVAEVLLE